jgi:polyketide synthase-like dehydratase family protein
VVHPKDSGLIADCRVLGTRQLPNNSEPQVTTHFTGRIRLTNQLASVSPDRSAILPGGRVIEAADIYRLYFHGPAYQVLERGWWDGNRIIALMAESLPNNHYPPERPTIIAPRVIELCFQAAGVWEMGVQGRMGLPRHIDRISFIRSPELAEGRLYAMVRPDPLGSFDAEVIDSQGHRYIELSGYSTVEFPNAVDAERLKKLRAAMTLGAVAAL